MTLGERLDTLRALADLKAAPDYFQANTENFGFANGLRCAVAVMSGTEYGPLRAPETWPPSDQRHLEQVLATLEHVKHDRDSLIVGQEDLLAALKWYADLQIDVSVAGRPIQAFTLGGRAAAVLASSAPEKRSDSGAGDV